jgi:hypothetical protein
MQGLLAAAARRLLLLRGRGGRVSGGQPELAHVPPTCRHPAETGETPRPDADSALPCLALAGKGGPHSKRPTHRQACPPWVATPGWRPFLARQPELCQGEALRSAGPVPLVPRVTSPVTSWSAPRWSLMLCASCRVIALRRTVASSGARPPPRVAVVGGGVAGEKTPVPRTSLPSSLTPLLNQALWRRMSSCVQGST